MDLLPFQIQHAKRVLESVRQNRVALDASDPGVGKTYVTAHVAREGGYSLLVVAPKPVLPAWRKVAAAFGAPVVEITNYEQIRLGKTPYGHFVGDQFVWSVPPNTLVVFDEAQRCKARSSKAAEMLIGAKRQGLRILMCSATAASNPLEMRAIGYALGLHRVYDYWSWATRHGVSRGRFGMEFDGDLYALEQLHGRIFRPGGPGSRLRIADIPEFPQTQIIAEPVDTGAERKIQAVYDRMKRDLNRALAVEDDCELDDLANQMDASKANHLTILLRARQEIEALKTKAIAAMAKDGVGEGMSVAIFVNFDSSIDEVAKALGTSCVIRGNQKESDRQRAIHKFQNNEEDFIVCNLRAGGVGVSLHDPTFGKPRLALISPTYSAQDLRQALGRVHRAGGAHSIQRIVFAAGTCEEDACEAVTRKLAQIDTLNDGDLQGQFQMPLAQKMV
jgi:superfamily II DNA or RNA helicase